MKQTAVEWLFEQVVNRTERVYFLKELEQAKEMEKEQIIDAFVECWKENMPEGYECKQSAEEYYNETFKNKEM
jgi:hypothetical protein